MIVLLKMHCSSALTDRPHCTAEEAEPDVHMTHSLFSCCFILFITSNISGFLKHNGIQIACDMKRCRARRWHKRLPEITAHVCSGFRLMNSCLSITRGSEPLISTLVMCYDLAECDRECEMEGGVIALPVSVPLPWQPPRSWASPGDPTASSSSPGSRCYQTLPLLPSRASSQPPAAAPRSSAPFSGGNGPDSRTPSRSHQSPNSLTPGRRRGRTSPPSCAACQFGKSLGLR